MKILLKAIFLIILIDKSTPITRLASSTGRPRFDEWYNTFDDAHHRHEQQQHTLRRDRKVQIVNDDINIDNNNDNDEVYPKPQLPWEEALRHSVYLTLVRDKINALLLKNEDAQQQLKNLNQQQEEELDVDLWRRLRKAPFKTLEKERGPIFGDIAILSRGKLLQTRSGYAFVEDENAKECIECHIYSARTNELEAERTLNNENEEGNIKALWTVRRIRHRSNEDKSPYRYELMFSVASAKTDYDDLDYNVPSQTFTIKENVKRNNNNQPPPFETTTTSTTSASTTSLVQDEGFFTPKNRYYEPEAEKTLWVPMNVDYEKHQPNRIVIFPEGENLKLNTGETYKTTTSQSPHFEFPIITGLGDSRGAKKFHKGDRVVLETEYELKQQQQPPAIMHLHHHYYLNDNGMPILKFPSSDRHKYVPNILENPNFNADIITGSPSDSPLQIPIFLPEKFNQSPTSQSPKTLQIQLASKKLKPPVPTKPFRPSPQEVAKIKYSELDPLYPTEEVTIASQQTTVEESTETTTFRTTEAVTTAKTTRHHTERTTRKPFRRLRTQKKYSDLIKAQLPPPDKITSTTVPYEITIATQSTSDTIHEPEASQKAISVAPTNIMISESRNRTIARQKYQRKPYTNWSGRRLKPKTTSKPEQVKINKQIPIENDNILESNNNYNTTAEYNSTELEENILATTTPTVEIVSETILALSEAPTERMTEATESTLLSSTNSVTESSSASSINEEAFTPLTRKSLVTSISLKLGNKTMPYYTPAPRNIEIIKKPVSLPTNKTIMDTLLKGYDFKNARRARISEFKNSKFQIYKAEETKSVIDADNDEITKKILEHAKSVS